MTALRMTVSPSGLAGGLMSRNDATVQSGRHSSGRLRGTMIVHGVPTLTFSTNDPVIVISAKAGTQAFDSIGGRLWAPLSRG